MIKRLLVLFIVAAAAHPLSASAKKESNADMVVRTMRSLPAGRMLVTRGPSEKQPGVIRVGVPGYDNKNERLREITGTTMMFEATAYSPARPSTFPHTDGQTAIGLPAGYGVVAVDPQVIPLGTRLYIEGYGYAIAADVGGAIEERRIDLCFGRRQSALQFGRRMVQVHVLGWAGTNSRRYGRASRIAKRQ